MAQGKRILQCLLFPAGRLVLASIPITAAGLIFVFAPANQGHWLTYPVYAFSCVCAYHCLRAYRQKCRLCPAGCERRYGSCAGHPAVFDRAGISGACFALPFAGDQPRLCCMESILRHPVSFCIVRDAGRLRKNLGRRKKSSSY